MAQQRKSDKKGGRPTIYSEELSDDICTRLADGESLRSICRDESMPALSTVLLWVVDGQHPEFSEQYAQAREAQGHSLADSMLELHRELRDGKVDAQQAKVIQDGIKWQAERLARKTYGQRQEIEHTGAIPTVTSDEMTPEDWEKAYCE